MNVVFHIFGWSRDVIWPKLAVEQRIKDQFLQKWHCELQSTSSCDLYCQLKDEFKFEKCLLCENRKYSQAVCNFWVSTDRKPKITGRYKGLERKKRPCTLCNGIYLGGEFRVFFECENTSMVDDRRKYLPKYFLNQPSMFKLIADR